MAGGLSKATLEGLRNVVAQPRVEIVLGDVRQRHRRPCGPRQDRTPAHRLARISTENQAGRSSLPPSSFRLPDYARCLAAFVRALQLEQLHLVGLSFGGIVALELFRRRTVVPQSLVLAGAYAGWAGSQPADVVGERLPRACGRSTPAGFRAMTWSSAEADLRDVLATVDVPTLLLYGDQDVRAPQDVAHAPHKPFRRPSAALPAHPRSTSSTASAPTWPPPPDAVRWRVMRPS